MPFSQEFDDGDNSGKSCEPFRMRIWDREESFRGFLSPEPDYPVVLCYETNVVVFNEGYEDRGLDSNFNMVIPTALLPTMPDGFTPSERGWASMDFYAGDAETPWGIGIDPKIEQNRHLYDHYDRAGLPVTGFLFSIYNTDDILKNHTTINAHKYTRANVDIE
jgi:hypothetical protein